MVTVSGRIPDVHSSYVVNKKKFMIHFFPRLHMYCAVFKLTFIWHLMDILRSISILLCGHLGVLYRIQHGLMQFVGNNFHSSVEKTYIHN